MSQFFVRDLYPNMGAATTFGLTMPEPEEHVALAQVKSEDQAPSNVHPKSKMTMFTWIGVAVILVILLQMGK